MLLAKGVSADDFSALFSTCFKILNIKFNICGISVSLMAFMLYGLVFGLLLFVILYLFRKY